MKTFFVTDKTGRGYSGQMSLRAILEQQDEDGDELPDGEQTLAEWAENAEAGDEMDARTEKYQCIEN